jgi:uncharacterized protein (TIRG00374 family)
MSLVSQNFLDFHWQYFGIAVGLAFFSNSLRFLKRAFSLRISGVKGLSFLNSIRLFVASLPLAALPAKMCESFQGIWLYRASGLPVDRAISVYVVDQLSDGLSIFVLTVIGALAYPAFWPIFLLIFLLFLTATIFLRIKPRDDKYIDMGKKIPALHQYIALLRGSIESHPSLFKTNSLLMAFILGILARAAEGAVLFFILAGLGLLPSLTLVATAILVYAFAESVAHMTTIPGGLGVVESAIALLLTLFLNFKPEIAVTATLLFRIATFWINFLIGILLWSVAGKSLGLDGGEGTIVKG